MQTPAEYIEQYKEEVECLSFRKIYVVCLYRIFGGFKEKKDKQGSLLSGN